MKQYGFGVDIGGTTCKIGLFDMTELFWKSGKSKQIQRITEQQF